jgi:hypothetical protein
MIVWTDMVACLRIAVPFCSLTDYSLSLLLLVVMLCNTVCIVLTVAMGMMLGADISITRLLFQALLPATLGNLVGGGLLVGAVYWYVFDSMDAIIHFRERIHYGQQQKRSSRPAANNANAVGSSESEAPAVTLPQPAATSLHAIDLHNGQNCSRTRYPDIYRRFQRQTSTPVASPPPPQQIETLA